MKLFLMVAHNGNRRLRKITVKSLCVIPFMCFYFMAFFFFFEVLKTFILYTKS